MLLARVSHRASDAKYSLLNQFRSEEKRWSTGRIGRLALLMLIPCTVLSAPNNATSQEGASSSSSTSMKPFLGRWDLTIKSPRRDLPSWIEVLEKQGQPKVIMVGVSDHATEMKKVELKGGELDFVCSKGDAGCGDDTLFKAKATDGELAGTARTADGAPRQWTGRRAPSLTRKGIPKWGKPVRLFNGKDLTAWHSSDPSQPSHWMVEDATLVSNGHGPEIITDSKFEDFKLHLEFNCGVKSNSGVYLRGRYEVQIETDSEDEPPSHHTGGVYGFLAPTPEQPRKSGEWQTFDITFVGRTITVVHNGTTVIDHQEVPGITGGAIDSHEELPGPIYLQGSEEGRVAFRNIVITPAKR